MAIDASEHLPLISRVISQMNLPPWEREEAYSQSLVTIVEAAKSFDPEKGPLANWLASKIRWGIKSWIAKQRQQPTVNLDLARSSEEPNSGRYETNLTFTQVSRVLTDLELRTLLAEAYGFKGKEIAASLEVSQVQVSRIKAKARAKLKEINV